MTRLPQVAMLPDGRRLHLQDGPIDLVIQAWGRPEAVRAAYRAAAQALTGLLDTLCEELPALRHAAGPDAAALHGPVARRMAEAVAPYAEKTFITPMAAVAGAVAEAVLGPMLAAADLDRAFVNNGGDIAIHCARGQSLTIGLVDRPDDPNLFGTVRLADDDAVRGIATSGWRGRSFSLGIADSVTVLARSAAEADAAATIIANAVDLPGHAAVRRAPADSIQHDSDLGARLVTRHVGPLGNAAIARALDGGCAVAEALIARGLILGAALQLQGRVRTLGAATRSRLETDTGPRPVLPRPEPCLHA